MTRELERYNKICDTIKLKQNKQNSLQPLTPDEELSLNQFLERMDSHHDKIIGKCEKKKKRLVNERQQLLSNSLRL